MFRLPQSHDTTRRDRRTVVFTSQPPSFAHHRRAAAALVAVLAAALGASGASSDAEMSFPPYPADTTGRIESVRITATPQDATLRAYRLVSTMEQRDNAASTREFSEQRDEPRVRTGNVMFDGLFAMAIDDMRLNCVSEIRDSSYNDGLPIQRDVFQTGEKWPYVWTRDVSYASDLGLAQLEPDRVVNALLFKTSRFRDGLATPAGLPAEAAQIVQDTGSGGSWPVSTDRVSWAIAARRVLGNLAGEKRERFAQQAHAALLGTVEADRLASFDAHTGLYGGEQSYLDWRTQTYAPWIVRNLSRMSGSKALSTNAAHYQALRLLARLCEERKEASQASRYTAWADALKEAINRHFWVAEASLYASLTTSAENQVAVQKYDMLGTALVILSGIAPEDRAREALARYPHAPYGVPVYFPQQPDVYVYHNRAVWPFVTAYSLRAAAHVRNTAVADHAVDSLMRAAALNLSNMENLEWLTGKPWLDDGPAINSRRQLWSVAGYISMVTETVFGCRIGDDGLVVDPFLTCATRRLLGDRPSATLENLRYKDRALDVVLELPRAEEGSGYFAVSEIRLNGSPVGPSQTISADALAPDRPNTVVVTFGPVRAGDVRLTRVPEVDPKDRLDPRVYSPPAPVITAVTTRDDRTTLEFAPGPRVGDRAFPVLYAIYRNGERVAGPVSETSWTDPRPAPGGVRVSYSVEAVYPDTGHRSHHSEPVCIEGGAVQRIAITDPRVASNLQPTPPGGGIDAPTLHDWGNKPDSLSVRDVELPRAGRYAIRVEYNNHAHTIDSGVTCAVKGVSIVDSAGRTVARGVIQMPNVEASADGRNPLRTSTEFSAVLPAGAYTIEFSDFFNMSYLDSNSTYSGTGGRSGPHNTAHIAAIEVIALESPPSPAGG